MVREVKIDTTNGIKSMFYFENKKELYVFFTNSSLYIYYEVTDKDVKNLEDEKEGGKYFYHNIRDKKEYTKRYGK